MVSKKYIAHSNTLDYKPGKLVPRATNVMAVTLSLRPTVQPKDDAMSPIKPVNTPIKQIDTTNAAQPPR